MTEAQRYQGALYRPEKGSKKVDPQELWTQAVGVAAEAATNARYKQLLQQLSNHTNVPRKKAKFINFARNSIRISDGRTLGELFDAIDAKMPKKQAQEDTKPAAADTKEANEEAKAPAPAVTSDDKAGKKRKREETTSAGDDGDKKEATTVVASSFSAKKRILAHLALAQGGKEKSKRLRKTVVEEAVSSKAFGSEGDAEAEFDRVFAKLLKRGKVAQDDSGKFTALAGGGAPGGGGDDDE